MCVCVCLSVCLSAAGTCTLQYNSPDDLKVFRVVIRPDEGYWKSGSFSFQISIPPEYNNKVWGQLAGYCAGSCVLYMCLVCCFPASWGEVSHSLVASKHHWNWWSLSEVSWAWKRPHLRSLVAIICNIILSAYLSEQGSLSKTHYSRPSHIQPSDIWNTQLSGSLYHYSN